MSIAEDYFDLFADPLDLQDDSGVICKFCGIDSLTWRHDGGWKLIDLDGSVHNCRLPPEPTADDFPAVH